MIAVDTSVAVAALATWHVGHERARPLAARATIPAHARLETYSVLTRMPPPHRLAAAVVVHLLGTWFPRKATLAPSAELSWVVVERCSDHDISGGAVYDAIVALTAAEAGATVVTRDRRAAATYGRLGVAFELTG